MARDWDLFAFVGVPTAMLLAVELLDRHYSRRAALAVVWAMARCCWVYIAGDPEVAIAHFRADAKRGNCAEPRRSIIPPLAYYKNLSEAAKARVEEETFYGHYLVQTI